jgi:tetratricopeptide (TPR) repeat protein
LYRLAKDTKLPEAVFRSIEIFGNGPVMPSPDVLEPPSGLSFGDLLDWHLRRGTRPPGTDKQGEPWKKAAFAGDVGVSDKQVRNWIANKSLPNDIITIERVLFGRDQKQCTVWRMELRDALKRTRTGSAPTGPAPGEVGPVRAEAEVPASNIPIRVPEHFLGRDDALAAIEAALNRYEGRVAITAVHGLRGVGKTTLAAAFAERHRRGYRATWWIRAQTETTMRTDLIALGVRLGWVAADEKEEPAVAALMERLRHEGESILLIYDNAIDADALKPYLPRGGAAKVLVTSNAHAWRGVAVPVEIRLWPKEIGADYLIARTGRDAERAAAENLSEALGGLPLAHEQAAAYCERLDISLAEYGRRFTATPARLLDDERHAPAEYHDGLTVAKTFALAIEEAGKLHPAAEPLIVHAALLAPEPIPLFLFAEAREKFGEPVATALANDGLEEAVAALRTFALLSRETIADERDPALTTETVRLHRLVRQVAAARREGDALEDARRALIEAMAAVFPEWIYNDPNTWPRARRIDGLALPLVDGDALLPRGVEELASYLLGRLASYRYRVLGAYTQARPLAERALAICERVLGPNHHATAWRLIQLARLHEFQGDLSAARPLHERGLGILEKVYGPEHPDTAISLNLLGQLLQKQGDLAAARLLYERALGIFERGLGPEHPDTSWALDNIASVLYNMTDLAGALPFQERALAIREKVLGPEHPDTAESLEGVARIDRVQGEFAKALPLQERALAIREKAFGPEHPSTALSLDYLARVLYEQGDLPGARPLYERALAIREKVLGSEHPHTAASLSNLGDVLHDQGDLSGAQPLYERAVAIREKVLGPEHPIMAVSLNDLARVLHDQGDPAKARPLYERALALAIRENVLGPEHPTTNLVRRNMARLLLAAGSAAEALTFSETALAGHEKVLGKNHRWTKDSAYTTADALAALGCTDEAAALRDRYDLERDTPEA